MSARASEGGVLKHWSASQKSTFDQCARRWAGEKVFRLPSPREETKALAEGSGVHNEIEAYGKKETTAVTHPLAALAVEWLEGNTGLLRFFEQDLSNPELVVADIAAKGFVDLIDVTNPKLIHIIDWKTRSSFDYCPTEKDLETNAQVVTYGMWAHSRYKADAYKLTHVNLRTGLKKPRFDNAVRVVSTVRTPDQLRVAFRPVEDAIIQMKEIAATAKEFNDVPANPDGGKSCWSFGRPCPYMSQCNDAVWFRPPREGSTSSTKPPTEVTVTMSEVERIKSKVRATGIVPPDAPKYETKTEEAPKDVITKVRSSFTYSDGAGVVTLNETTPRTVPPATGLLEAAVEEKANSTSSTEAPVQAESTATVQPTPAQEVPLVLFIDCLPARGEISAQNLEDLIAPVAKAIADKAKVEDVRLVPYGQGVAALCAFFRANAPKGFVLASSTGLSGLVIEALLPLSAQAWRGVR